MSDLVIVKMDSIYPIKADKIEYWRKEIMKQKETGVIVLPWFLTAVVVPEDTEIQFEEDKSCSNCKFWRLDKNDEKRMCRYCFEMDEWVSEKEE